MLVGIDLSLYVPSSGEFSLYHYRNNVLRFANLPVRIFSHPASPTLAGGEVLPPVGDALPGGVVHEFEVGDVLTWEPLGTTGKHIAVRYPDDYRQLVSDDLVLNVACML